MLLIAPDAFKGTLSAPSVARAIARGARGIETDICPIADGGEGTRDVLASALGGETLSARVHDPLGRPIEAPFTLAGDTAVVEVAQASGLSLVADGNDPLRASTRGTGELIVAAARAGARRILVCAGGSATTDGGRGAIEAIDAAGDLDARLEVLCDVRTPFEQAARRFAPQKGADARTTARLHARLMAMHVPPGRPFTGAAGGLAGGLWSRYSAKLSAGAPAVLDAIGFDGRMRAARLVVTGEGRIDRTTLEGKAVAEVATRARQAGVAAIAVVGADALDPFDARILDLQAVLTAGDERALTSAGRHIAALLLAPPTPHNRSR